MSEERKPQQVPSVGQVVHYVAYGTPGGEFQPGAHRAAMITEIYPSSDPPFTADMTQAGLVVFNPTGQYFNRHVPFDPTGTIPGSWHWPEFVPNR